MNLNDVIQRVKVHPGILGTDVTRLSEDNFAFAVGQQISSAINDLISPDAGTRRYITTNPADVTVTLDAGGMADLQPLVISDGLLLEYLHMGEITHPDWDFPLVELSGSGEGALEGNLDSMFAHYWMVGTVLHTRGDGAPLADDLGFAVLAVPGLNSINIQLIDDLVDMVVRRMRGVPVPVQEPAKK